MMRAATIFLALFLLLVEKTSAQTYQPEWSSLDARPTPEWWQDAKFGVFIHWGVYSVPAYTPVGNYAEWYQHALENNTHEGRVKAYHDLNYGAKTYYDLADDFHAELFNPNNWARLFERAGARYVVLTSKHHDGFCLWPSQQANLTWGFPWNSMDRGPHRDLVGDLFTALRKTSVRPGLYYSLYEWFNPMWKFDQKRYASNHAMPQLYDLVNRYQPDVVWADGDWDATPDTWQSPQFLAWLYNESPVRDKVVVNDRWGSGVRFKHGGVYTPEYQPHMDFDDHAWEESRGMGFSYGYNRAEDAWDYNSAQTLILHLIDKVSRGGNFLLDIGPDAHGQIPPIMQERLLKIGDWLTLNGEAIYGTRRWRTPYQWSEGRRDYKPQQLEGWKTAGDALLKQTINPEAGYAVKELFFTWNPKTKCLYAIFPRYPNDRKITLKNINLPISTEVTMVGARDKLRWESAGANTIVHLPEYNPARFKSAEAYVIKIANYGAFVEKPEIQLDYNPNTMTPTVAMGCGTAGALIRYTLDGTEPNANSLLYQQPFELKKSTKVRAKAYKAGLLESVENSLEVKTYAMMPNLNLFQAPSPGLRLKLLAPGEKPTSETIERGQVLRNTDVSSIEIDPSCTSKCAMVWMGYLDIPFTGGYQFWTESDEGSQLFLDGQLVVDNKGIHGMEERSGMALMQKGWHTVKLTYFNNSGAAGLKVYYAPVDGARQELPSEMMAH